jgi:hypothetical protein
MIQTECFFCGTALNQRDCNNKSTQKYGNSRDHQQTKSHECLKEPYEVLSVGQLQFSIAKKCIAKITRGRPREHNPTLDQLNRRRVLSSSLGSAGGADDVGVT